jgi:cell wall-associated NlpC family hydrolase
VTKDKKTATQVKPEPVPDPRRNAYRDDLADHRLKGRVTAAHFAPGVVRQVMRPAVPLRRNPEYSASLDTELLFGETVTLYDTAEGWAWVQALRDGYVGYIPADALTADVTSATHRVQASGTFVYPAPDMKVPPLMHLSLNSQLAIAETGERFCRLAGGGFVVTRHIAALDRYARDFVEVAEQLIGTPYLWGGRTRIGLDCSGLVQLSLEAAGVAAPRDSDMQQAELGETVLVPKDLEGLERGDLIFWKGHVGIMTDGIMFLHANAHHMAVVMETLPEAVDRISKTGSEITAIKRIRKAGA